MPYKELTKKALKCAKIDIKTAPNKAEANARYLKWSCFHRNYEFLAVVKWKKDRFNVR